MPVAIFLARPKVWLWNLACFDLNAQRVGVLNAKQGLEFGREDWWFTCCCCHGLVPFSVFRRLAVDGI